MRMKKSALAFVLLLLVILAAGAAFAAAKPQVLRMATTTSTDNTGLLDYLAPILLKDKNIDVQWVSVGTGKALEYGKNGDVDIVLVHDPDAEKKFVEEGAGVNKRQVMYNDFVIIGPANDPAGIKGKKAGDALQTIAAKAAPFASRADKSGTHMAELKLWKEAGIEAPDKQKWYIQTGQGMLETINVAAERKGYVLTDRGTFIAYEAKNKGKDHLVILVEGDPNLRNQYSVIAVNPSKWPNVKYDLALQYISWITSPKVQKDIADFKMEGKQLFFPNADKK